MCSLLRTTDAICAMVQTMSADGHGLDAYKDLET